MDFSFFWGLGLGGIGLFFTMRTVQKQEILKLKKNFATQQEAYESQLQLQAENYSLEMANQAQDFQQAIADLEQRIASQTQIKERLEQKLQREKELSLASQKKLRENNRDIDEILESLEQSQQDVLHHKEAEISQLKAQLQEYAVNLEQQRVDLFNLQQQSASQQKTQGDRLNAEQIQTLVGTLLPEITLLRDSLNVLVDQPENLAALIKALKDILEGQAYAAKKVRATDNKWTECRVPHINLMRLYYQKCKKTSGYQILISPKKNQKSQDQDYEWLKNQSSC
ncbi:hypothetical protein FEK30_04825 [Picosynechococcus sp. PCC 11901]|uniref:hypothetical protein n=1 Tax=Picosynechococcus sp. PCC 11901 TaxID=2579791 RepID=UPI0010FC382F|nr:hypothetical protein [Picosynechococcus sp. PCC 11901]QCS48812.1 hypothetical protein FEK30_04825 [Picosynechococcus sp. PCC 11901]